MSGDIDNGTLQDFLIAVISPDSVESGWCQRELSLAATQGINEKRAKVLPVRYRGAEIPAMLGDTFYGDADRYSIETIAESSRPQCALISKDAARRPDARQKPSPPSMEMRRDLPRALLTNSRSSRRLRSGRGTCSQRGKVSGTAATSAI